MKVIRVWFVTILCCGILVLLWLTLFITPQTGIRESFAVNKETYISIIGLRMDLPTTFLCRKKAFADPNRINITINDMRVMTNEILNDAQVKLIDQSGANELFVFPNKKKPSISQITIKESYVIFDENTAIKRYGIIYLPEKNSCPPDLSLLNELDDDWYYFKYEP